MNRSKRHARLWSRRTRDRNCAWTASPCFRKRHPIWPVPTMRFGVEPGICRSKSPLTVREVAPSLLHFSGCRAGRSANSACKLSAVTKNRTESFLGMLIPCFESPLLWLVGGRRGRFPSTPPHEHPPPPSGTRSIPAAGTTLSRQLGRSRSQAVTFFVSCPHIAIRLPAPGRSGHPLCRHRCDSPIACQSDRPLSRLS